MNAWKGYIELVDNESVVTCDIRPNGDHVSIWVDEDLADDVTSRAFFIRNYGDRFFNTLADYRAGQALNIDDVWPLA